MAFLSALELSGPALDAASRQVMDVDQWARTFALQSLIGNRDSAKFLELRNIGAEALDIGGSYFDAGVAFTFAAGTTLAAGESIVLVRNLAAFQARYGAVPRVAGSYAPSSLANAGETLTLRDARAR